jgi:hypothetical protein
MPPRQPLTPQPLFPPVTLACPFTPASVVRGSATVLMIAEAFVHQGRSRSCGPAGAGREQRAGASRTRRERNVTAAINSDRTLMLLSRGRPSARATPGPGRAAITSDPGLPAAPDLCDHGPQAAETGLKGLTTAAPGWPDGTAGRGRSRTDRWWRRPPGCRGAPLGAPVRVALEALIAASQVTPDPHDIGVGVRQHRGI